MESTENTLTRNHSQFSPSRWPGLIACGFYAPSDEPGDAAKLGTAAHTALEILLNGGTVENAFEAAKTAFTGFSDEDRTRVLDAYARITEFAAGAKIATEQKVCIVPGVWGYLDATWRDGSNKLVVLDYKHFFCGEKDYLPQLAAYASALVEPGDDSVLLVIDSREGLRSVEVPVKWCRAQWYLVRSSVFEAEHGFSKPSPNPWCKYCSRRGTCEGCADTASLVAAYNERGITNHVTWAELNPEQKGRALAVAEDASRFAEAVRDLAKTDLVSGLAVDGWKLQSRKGTRRVADVSRLISVLESEGVAASDIQAKIKLSSTDASSLLNAIGKSRKETDAILDGVCYRAPETVSIVRDGCK